MSSGALESLKARCVRDPARVTLEDLPTFKGLFPTWDIVSPTEPMSKWYLFEDFSEALSFVNAVAAEAEQQNHHPDIWLTWAKVVVRWITHSVGGLSTNDFIMAKRCDEVYASRSKV